jgi:hypothetical protein
MGPLIPVTQLPQPSSRGDPRRPRAWSVHHTRHEGGSDAPRGSATPINLCAGKNRPKDTTASGAVIRGVQGERRHIPGSAAPGEPAAPGMWPPCAPPTFLPIKATSHSLDHTHNAGASPFLFSSQSESAALHTPAALRELVEFSLPWLSFALVLYLELTRVDRLC